MSVNNVLSISTGLASPIDANSPLEAGSLDPSTTNNFQFSTDGTKLFILSGFYKILYRYDLSSAFNISTAVKNDAQTYTFQAEGSNTTLDDIRCVIFSTDGKLMIARDSNYNAIITYELATAWDLTTLTYHSSPSYTVNFTDGHPHKVGPYDVFNLVNTGQTAYSAHMCKEFSLGGLTSPSQSQDPTNIGNAMSGIHWGTGGNTVWISESIYLYVYTVSNPYTLDDLTYVDNVSLSWTPKDFHMTANDARIFYVRGNTYLYYRTVSYNGSSITLGSLLAWDLNDMFPSEVPSIAQLTGVTVSPDGTNIYIANDNYRYIYQFSMSTPFDFSTAVYVTRIDNADFGSIIDDSPVTGLSISPTGGRIYLVQENYMREAYLTTAWDLSTINYIGISDFDASSGSPSLDFSPDGTTLLKIDDFSLDLYDTSQYRIVTFASSNSITSYSSITYNLDGSRALVTDSSNTVYVHTTANFSRPNDNTYVGQFDLQNSNAVAGGLEFNRLTGDEFFFRDNENDIIAAYDLTTAVGNLTKINSSSQSINPELPNTAVQNFVFGNSGSKLYTINSIDDKVYQYTLSTPYDITTVTSDSNEGYSVGLSTPISIRFKSDGTKFYVLDRANDQINQYSLSIAWDILSTVTPDGTVYDLTNELDNPYDFLFNPTGTKMTIVALYDSYQYTLGTAWNLSTASLDGSIAHSDLVLDGTVYSATFANNGTIMYVNTIDYIERWSLSTAYNVLTATRAGAGERSKLISNVYPNNPGYQEGIEVNNNSTKLYVANDTGEITEFDITSDQDHFLTSYGNDDLEYDASKVVVNAADIKFNNNGTKIYIVDYGVDRVKELELSVAYDITTARYFGVNLSVGSEDSNPRGITFKPDGTKMFMVGHTNDDVYQYSLSTAWDLSTATYDNASFGLRPNPVSITFDSTGSKMYIAELGKYLSIYTVTNYSVGSATLVGTVSLNSFIPTGSNSINAFTASSDGLTLYFSVDTGLSTIINIFEVSTPFTLSSTTSSAVYPIRDTRQIFGIALNPNSSSIYDFYLTKYTNATAYHYEANLNFYIEQQKLTASDAASSDQFSRSVAISGDTAIVGAYRDDDNGTDSGSAYIYTRSGSTWTEQQKITASDGASYDYFGYSVAIDGDTAIVGAYLDDDNGNSSGSAYVFTRTGGVWTEQQKLTASDGAGGDYFGFSVAISGDTAIVGAYLDNDNGSGSGSAYIYTRSGSTWTEQQKLTDSDGAVDDYFGFSVAISGDTAIVGAYRDDDNGTDSGSAYIYTRSGSTWTEQQKLTASDGASYDYFGRSVAISGDTAIVGAYRNDDVGTDSGSAYIFTRSGSTWTEQQKITASDGAIGDNFGFSVAISGDTAIVGALFDDDNSSDSGSAYIFEGGNGAPELTDTHILNYGATIIQDAITNSAGTKLLVLDSVQDHIREHKFITPNDFSTLYYDYKLLDLPNQSDSITLGDSGTKLYVCSQTSDTIDQYELSVTDDISSASYTTKLNFTNPISIDFNINGTKAIILDNNGVLHQYNLETAWNVNSAILDTSLNLESIYSKKARWHKNGFAFYVTEIGSSSGDRIDSYTCTVAYDISTVISPEIRSSEFITLNGFNTIRSFATIGGDGSYFITRDSSDDYVRFYLRPEWLLEQHSQSTLFIDDTGNNKFIVADNGTKGYFMSTFSNASVYIFQVIFDTAYDLDSIRYTGKFFRISFTTASDIFLKSDGTKLYLVDYNDVVQFKFNTAFDITSLEYEKSNTVLTDSGFIHISDDGKKLIAYEANTSTFSFDIIREYNLNTPWDIGQIQLTASFGISKKIPQFPLSLVKGMYIGDSGYSVYLIGTHYTFGYDTLIKFSLPESYSTLRDIEYDNANQHHSNTLPGNNASYYGLYVNDNEIYTLSTSSLNKIVYLKNGLFGTHNFVVKNLFTGFVGAIKRFKFDTDGKRLFILDDSSILHSYSVGVDFDISSATYSGNSIALQSTTNNFFITSNGKYLYNIANGVVYKWNMSYFDIENAVLSADTYTVNARAMHVTDNGDRVDFLKTESGNNVIARYDLSSAFTLSTASRNGTEFLGSDYNTVQDFIRSGSLVYYLTEANIVNTNFQGVEWYIESTFDNSQIYIGDKVTLTPKIETRDDQNFCFTIGPNRIFTLDGNFIKQQQWNGPSVQLSRLTDDQKVAIALDVLEFMATQDQVTGNLEITDDPGVTNTLIGTFTDTSATVDYVPGDEVTYTSARIGGTVNAREVYFGERTETIDNTVSTMNTISTKPLYYVSQAEYTTVPTSPPATMGYESTATTFILQEATNKEAVLKDIADYVLDYMVSRIDTPNSYYISTNIPTTDDGTWVSVTTFVDTYNKGASTDTVTLWRRVTERTTGNDPHPREYKNFVKLSNGELVEFTQSEMLEISKYVRQRIFETGIGDYEVTTSNTPPSVGSWQRMDDNTWRDRREEILADAGYVRTLTTQSATILDNTFIGYYTGPGNIAYTGDWFYSFSGNPVYSGPGGGFQRGPDIGYNRDIGYVRDVNYSGSYTSQSVYLGENSTDGATYTGDAGVSSTTTTFTQYYLWRRTG